MTSITISKVQQNGTGATNRLITEKLNDFVSVLDFGADPTGLTDSTTAIQNAINYCTTSPFKALYVPSGTYSVTSLTVSGAGIDRFTMFGDGRHSELLSTTAGPVIDVTGSLGNTFQYPLFVELTFRNTNASGVGMKTRFTEFLKLVRCNLLGTSVGLQMSITANEYDIKPYIERCFFANGAYGIRGGDTRVADAWVMNNLFLNNTSYAIEFGYLDGGTITGNKIFSDNGASNGLIGMNLKKPIYLNIEMNEFFENGGNAIKLSSPRSCRVRDNRIVGVGDNARTPAIYITDYDGSVEAIDNQITGNTIKDVGGYGLHLDSSFSTHKDYIIADNTFENVGSGAVLYDAMVLHKLSNSTIARNKIDGRSATRYWLHLDGSTNITLNQNEHKSCVNADFFTQNTPTALIVPGCRYNQGVTATSTLLRDDDGLVTGLLTGAILANLPSAVQIPGKRYTIVKADAGAFAVTVTPNGAETIDGAANLAISTQYAAAQLISTGTGWVTVTS